jgi:glycosyltransferase involved in cell wall biosynthesis
VIPYGVAFAAEFPTRLRRKGHTLRIIYAGRLDVRQKRVLDLADIIKAAADRGIGIRLTVAGSGPAETQLRSKCESTGIKEQVTFVGTLEAPDLTEMLADQDAVLLVSDFEGLPLIVLEAMGQGCIPIVSDIRSGVWEVIHNGRNGFRVPVGDIRGFSDRLAELHEDPTRRRLMAEAAYDTIRSGRYRRDTMVDSYVDLFRRVITDAERGTFKRPAGRIEPPLYLPWQEYLAEPIQRVGHQGKRLLAKVNLREG